LATPNLADTQGRIYHSDWEDRFEGVWGDAKAGQVLALECLFEGSAGRPGDSGVAELKSAAVVLEEEQLLMLTVDPGGFWGGI